MRRTFRWVIGILALVLGALLLWRRDRRIGTGVVNQIVNPMLIRSGMTGGRHAEVAELEHIGRRSGTRRVTLVHPVPIAGGFRITVPLGERSEWTRNVVVAGHARLSMRGIVYELDEPALLVPMQVEAIPRPIALVQSALGFRHLRLHCLAEAPGTLATGEGAVSEADTEAPARGPQWEAPRAPAAPPEPVAA